MLNSATVKEISDLHRDSIIRWKSEGIVFIKSQFLALVEENHSFNFRLWHAEDKARRDDLGFEFVYHAKREIDHFNQERNNRMEAMDAWLINYYPPPLSTECPVHSETPGMIIDRLSILALKFYHMKLQLSRLDIDENHYRSCESKCLILSEQQKQLLECLAQLFDDIHHRKRTFTVYHQFKMYNDPNLNPELCRSKLL